MCKWFASLLSIFSCLIILTFLTQVFFSSNPLPCCFEFFFLFSPNIFKRGLVLEHFNFHIEVFFLLTLPIFAENFDDLCSLNIFWDWCFSPSQWCFKFCFNYFIVFNNFGQVILHWNLWFHPLQILVLPRIDSCPLTAWRPSSLSFQNIYFALKGKKIVFNFTAIDSLIIILVQVVLCKVQVV